MTTFLQLILVREYDIIVILNENRKINFQRLKAYPTFPKLIFNTQWRKKHSELIQKKFLVIKNWFKKYVCRDMRENWERVFIEKLDCKNWFQLF